TAREAPERARGDSEARIRTFDPFGKRRIDREVPLAGESEKTHGEVGVVGGERGFDLTRRNGGVERARDRVVGERRRIVLGSEQELRLEGGRRGSKRGERRCALRTRNRSPAPPASNFVKRGAAGKGPAGKNRRAIAA